MGYNLYWKRPAEIEKTIFLAILDDFRKLLDPLHAAGVRLADGFGKGEPVIHENGVWFNGAEKCGHDGKDCPNPLTQMLELTQAGDAEGLQALFDDDWLHRRCPGSCSFETFQFERLMWEPHIPDDSGWRGVKTNRRHYDLAVTAFLIVAKRHLGEEIELSGVERYWIEARELCQYHLGYGREMQLFPPEDDNPTPDVTAKPKQNPQELLAHLTDMFSKLNFVPLSDQPMLHRQPWDEAQEKNLVEAYRSGEKLNHIAERMSRTVQSLRMRLVQLGEFSPDGFDPRTKSETIQKTLTLFREGLTLEQIVQERGLAYSTVGGHLSSAIWMGETVDLDRLLSHSDIVAINDALDGIGPASIQRLSQALKGQYDYTLLKIGWAACRPRVLELEAVTV